MDGSVETSRRTLGPKPRLAPKPFSLQKTSTIRSINAPRAFTATSKPTNVPSGNAETPNVPKGTLPVTAQTPPQRTAAADSKPSSLSVRIKDEEKSAGEEQQREDPLAQATGVPKASTPTTAQTPPQQTAAPVSGHIKDEPKTDSKTEESKSRAGTSDSTAAPGKTDPVLQTSGAPKGAPPTPAQKPQQTTTTDEHSPVSVSKRITDEPKPTTPSPHTEHSPVVAPAKLAPALQTTPPKESSAFSAAQKEDVIQTNHKAAAEKNEEDKTSVQKPEESGSVSPSAANPAYLWGGTRRRLSSKLTSKFESTGPPVCPPPTITASTASNKDAVKKPVTSPPEESPAAPEPSKAASNEEELIDYSGGDSIKRRISQLFDSSLRPEAVTKREESDIKAGSGGVKERIKNWVTDTSSEDPKLLAVQRTRSRSVDSPASPVGDITPNSADAQLPSPASTQAVTPSTKDSPVKQTPVETLKGEAVEKKPHERTTDLPGEQEQNKPVEAEVTLRHPKVSTDHAAVDEGHAGSSESPALKRNNAKRRSVRFGIVETDDGAPPLILGSPSDSSSEEDPSGDKGGENTSASAPVYRRVGHFMKGDGESQKNEEEHETRVELEKRLKAEEDKQARLKLEEELIREDEEREKENARRREEEKQRGEEREKQRLKEQEVQRQEEEERERQRLKEEEQKKQMAKLRAEEEKELEQMRQKEEDRARARQMEERLRLEEMERVRKEAEEQERENQRRREEEEKMKVRQRQEEERIRRMELEIRMQQEKEEERMRQIEKQREDERRKQLEKERAEELEGRRLKELEEKLRMEEATTRDLISLDSKDVPQKPERLLSSVPNLLEPSENAADIIYDDFSVKTPKIDVDFEDFSVKPRRWGSQAKVEKPPVQSWRAEPVDEDAVVLVDVHRQETEAPEKVVEPDRPEPTPATECPEEEEEEVQEPAEEWPVSVELEEEAEDEGKDTTGEADSTDSESEDGEEQVNSYCVNPEDEDTDALIDTSPDQQNGFCELTNQADSPKSVPEHVPEVSSEDVDPTDSSTQPDFVPFPESSAPLLDNSAQRSKVALRKSQIRRAPSRSLRLAQTESQSWRVHDSTDEKNGSTKQEDSEPQGKQPKLHKASSPSTAMNPAAQLIAQLKRRTSGGGAGKKEVKEEVKQREESESQQEEVAPTPVPRSPRKSAQLAGAALVLPPLGGSDGGAVSSPAWLKELKSKKRLSQHDSET